MSAPTILATTTGDSARTRRTDPWTSHAAADSISVEALEDREREVLDIVAGASRPLCAQQIELTHDTRVCTIVGHQAYAHSSIRTAIKQLADGDAIVPSGTARTHSKRDAVCWAIAPVDHDAYARRLALVAERRIVAAADRRLARNRGAARPTTTA